MESHADISIQPSLRAYTSPELTEFGSIHELTAMVGPNGMSDGGTSIGQMSSQL